MTLREQFEKETREELPLLKNYEYDHEEYYSDTANYFAEYSKWLETKLQNTSSNSDYAKCPRCGSEGTFLYRTCGACDWNDYVEQALRIIA